MLKRDAVHQSLAISAWSMVQDDKSIAQSFLYADIVRRSVVDGRNESTRGKLASFGVSEYPPSLCDMARTMQLCHFDGAQRRVT